MKMYNKVRLKSDLGSAHIIDCLRKCFENLSVASNVSASIPDEKDLLKYSSLTVTVDSYSYVFLDFGYDGKVYLSNITDLHGSPVEDVPLYNKLSDQILNLIYGWKRGRKLQITGSLIRPKTKISEILKVEIPRKRFVDYSAFLNRGFGNSDQDFLDKFVHSYVKYARKPFPKLELTNYLVLCGWEEEVAIENMEIAEERIDCIRKFNLNKSFV
ncbi:hypothetical protein ACOIWI_004214 [Vibrio vulnificus]